MLLHVVEFCPRLTFILRPKIYGAIVEGLETLDISYI